MTCQLFQTLAKQNTAPSSHRPSLLPYSLTFSAAAYLLITSSVSSTISSTISSTSSDPSSFFAPFSILLPKLGTAPLTSSPGRPSSSVVAFRQARHSSNSRRRISTTARFAESFFARSTSSKIRLYSRKFLRIFFCSSFDRREGGLGRHENCLKRSTGSSRRSVPRKS